MEGNQMKKTVLAVAFLVFAFSTLDANANWNFSYTCNTTHRPDPATNYSFEVNAITDVVTIEGLPSLPKL
jgi:hypothetical protein